MNFFRKTLWDVIALSVLTACDSFASQYMLGMNPCVLYILQRPSVLAVGLAVLSAAFFRRSPGLGRMVYTLAAGIPAVYGAGVAVYQCCVQNLPPGTTPRCGAPWTFRLRDWPLFEWYESIIRDFDNCAVPDYLLGVSLPIWSVLYFCSVLLLVWSGQFKARVVG